MAVRTMVTATDNTKTTDGASIPIPQILAIQSVGEDGRLYLKKAVRTYLKAVDDEPVFLVQGDEVWLTAQGDRGTPLALEGRGRVTLPEAVLSRLGLTAGGDAALVQRPDAVAVKRVAVEAVPGEVGRLLDVETPTTVTRRVETMPMPEVLLPRLQAVYEDLALRYTVMDFLSGRASLNAWVTRRMLACAEAEDDALRDKLVEVRLAAQRGDGSWDQDVVQTARCLRELSDLAVPGDHPAVARAVAWLAARPESDHNPGQWFGDDALVAEQAEVVAARRAQKRGSKPRFRAIKAGEKRRVMAGDALIQAPCGPRIMWPNALVVEALLRLGYEAHPRVQRALTTMASHDWCECAYQHGFREIAPLTEDAVRQFETDCMAAYTYAGLASPEVLLERTMAHRPFRQERYDHPSGDGEEDCYLLRKEDHVQGCEFITTRALAPVQAPLLHRFARAHLWRFASRQLDDGRFPPERYGTGFGQAGILDALARYDHPAVHVMVMRALPWIVVAQQTDGSWGDHVNKDAATRAVVSALLGVRVWLPQGLVAGLEGR